jgi:hypothetical protein
MQADERSEQGTARSRGSCWIAVELPDQEQREETQHEQSQSGDLAFGSKQSKRGDFNWQQSRDTLAAAARGQILRQTENNTYAGAELTTCSSVAHLVLCMLLVQT